ncbi:MAG TPA: hypothetical protein VMU68_05655 [Acidimicrobiales bacterium]|nr:hypothetical protein [Acidimicrobiales bacterium]
MARCATTQMILDQAGNLLRTGRQVRSDLVYLNRLGFPGTPGNPGPG